MRRVTRGPIVLLTFDPAHRPWLTDYLPALAALDEAQMPKMSDYEKWLGPVRITPVPVPHDCSDGFLYAYWRRPAAYLDPKIRSGSSSFWAIGDAAEAGLGETAPRSRKRRVGPPLRRSAQARRIRCGVSAGRGRMIGNPRLSDCLPL